MSLSPLLCSTTPSFMSSSLLRTICTCVTPRSMRLGVDSVRQVHAPASLNRAVPPVRGELEMNVNSMEVNEYLDFVSRPSTRVSLPEPAASLAVRRRRVKYFRAQLTAWHLVISDLAHRTIQRYELPLGCCRSIHAIFRCKTTSAILGISVQRNKSTTGQRRRHERQREEISSLGVGEV